jgi:hypothetical protein
MDMRDVVLEAQAEVQAIMREVVQELMKPQIMAQLRQSWISAPDEVKEMFKREKPEDYAALMEELKRR